MFIIIQEKDGGQAIKREVNYIVLYPTNNLKDGYIEVQLKDNGNIRIVVTEKFKDKVTIKGII